MQGRLGEDPAEEGLLLWAAVVPGIATPGQAPAAHPADGLSDCDLGGCGSKSWRKSLLDAA